MSFTDEKIAPSPETGTPYGTSLHSKNSHADVVTSDEEADLTPAQRRRERIFLWKLDLIYCAVAMVAFVFKIVDQYNIQNAYVSGMKEEINIQGNEYNWFTTYFNIGYVIILYPACFAVSHWGPHWWLPSCELIWGVLTCCLSVVQNSQHVYALRFLIGLAEGTAFPGNTTIIAQWYMPNEMATRMALFNLAQPIGGIISGVMQAGLTKNLDGKLGRSGWRWAFIVNGVCTIVVALIAFVTQPGMPDKPNPLARWYLTDEDYEIARRRNRRAKYTPQRPLTLKSFFNAFRYWQVYALVCCWSYGYNTVPSNFFNLWLKSLVNADGSKRFSVPQLSLIPMGGHAVCFIAIILFCGLSDRIGARLPSLLACAALNLVSQVILVMRPENDATHMAGYFLNYAGLPAYLLIATWAGTYLAHLPEVKVVMYATGTTVSYLSVAFIPLWAYPAKEAPNWNVGAKFYLGSMCVVTAVFIATAYGLRWEQRKQLRREGKEVPKRNWFYWLWT